MDLEVFLYCLTVSTIFSAIIIILCRKHIIAYGGYIAEITDEEKKPSKFVQDFVRVIPSWGYISFLFVMSIVCAFIIAYIQNQSKLHYTGFKSTL